MTNAYYNRVTDFVPDTAVRSADMDAELNGVVTGFDLLSDPTKLGNGALMLGTESGTADNYVYSNGGAAAILDGQMITFPPGNANTGASVVAHNGGANMAIVRNDGTALGANDLVAGVTTLMIYDETNTRWIMIGATAAQTAESTRTSIKAETGTTYTVLPTDENTSVTCTNAAAIAVTVDSDTNQATPIGQITHIVQGGAGQVTLAAGAGVTLNTGWTLKTRAQYAALSIIKTAANTWLVLGDMSQT